MMQLSLEQRQIAYRRKLLEYPAIPEHMHESIISYITGAHRGPCGSFLTAVLSNDLWGAVEHADADNAAALADWVRFLSNNAPMDAWGSPEAVERWTAQSTTTTT